MMRPEDQPLGTRYDAEWSTWTRRLAVILLLISGILAIYLLGPVLQITVLSLLLAFGLFYPVRALTRRFGFRYAPSVLIVFFIYLVIIITLVTNFSVSISAFISSFSRSLQNSINLFMEQVRDYTPGTMYLPNPFNGQRLIDLDFIYQPLQDLIKAENMPDLSSAVPSLVGTASSTVGAISGFIGTFFLMHLLALLFLLEVPSAFAWGLNLASTSYRREIAILLHRITRVWTGFFRGQLIISAAIGVLTWLQLLLMGIPGAVVVGLFVGVVSLIPILGSIIALVPIGLAPLLQGSTILTEMSPLVLMLLVLVPNFVVQQIIWNIISPKVTGDAVRLPAPMIILGIFIGSAFAGILGALLAAPLMGTVRLVVEYFIKKIRGGDPFPGEPEPDFMTRGMFSAEIQAKAIEAEEMEPSPDIPPV
jgi:predicted PurR-regulated permease PerM